MFMFSVGKEVIGVDDLNQYRHMKLLKWSLKAIAAYPKKELGEPQSKLYFLQNAVLLSQAVICLFLTVAYVAAHYQTHTFYNLGHMYITIFMTCITVSRFVMVLLPKYRALTAFYFNRLHLIFHKNKSKYAMETHILVHKMCHFFTIYLHAMMFMGIVLFNVTPLYKNYRAGLFSSHPPANVTFEHAVYYALPFDCFTDKRGYFIIFSYNWITSYCCSASFCTFDLFLSLQVFHLWGHLKIMKDHFEAFPRPKAMRNLDKNKANSVMFTSEEMVHVTKLLVEYIEHHKFVLDFNDNLSTIWGPIVFIYYMFHQICGCLLLLLCSQLDPDALIQYGPLTIIIFQQLIQISIVFELVGSMSEKLIPAVYDLPWECMDAKGRLLVIILLVKVQIPMHLKALGMADVGVQTMASILKTSLSYFAFLRTVGES